MKRIATAIKNNENFPIYELANGDIKMTFSNGFTKMIGENMNDIIAWARLAGYRIIYR